MRMSKPALASAVFLACIVSASTASQGDWPRWRGPDDNGVAPVGDYPIAWSTTSNVLWKAPLPGKGCSTPIVWNRRIFLTAPVEGKDAVLAFDESGRPLWRAVFGPEHPGRNKAGSGCNPSAVTDGRTLFAYFKSSTLAAMNLDGKVLWRTNLEERYGPIEMIWDIGTSPVLTEKDAVVAVMHGGKSYIVAFDKLTGEVHWRVDRNYTVSYEADHAYTTPVVFRHRGRESLLVWGAEHLTIHDAADGQTTWDCGQFNPEAKRNWPPVASPVIAGDIAVVPYGRGARLHGVRLEGSGDVTATKRLWMREDSGSYVPTPVAYQGRVYVLRDRERIGIDCIDPATGKTLWFGELPKGGGAFYASPIIAGGNLYATREDGVVFVAPAEGEFRILAENRMEEPVIATPAPMSSRLLIRGEKNLFCIGSAR